MSIPNPNVFVEFDSFDPNFQPYFELDNATKGRLDNTDFLLAPSLVDITLRTRSFNINRGKSRRFANFQAASATIELNNHDRAFDPLFEASPFAGNIVPRRRIQITSNNNLIFTGFIEDWDLTYSPDGDSIAVAKCYDGFYILAGQTISELTPTEETTGERIETILSLPEIAWSEDNRNINTGIVDVGTQQISDNTAALSYLQKVSETESGLLFVSANGDVTFKDRYPETGSELVEFSNEDIPFNSVEVIYGSELLYNSVTIANDGGGTAVASDTTSQDKYGVRELVITDLLGANDNQSTDLALYYIEKYSEPEYRIESLEVSLHSLDEANQNRVLNLELGDSTVVKFTPNDIPPTIERTLTIISINHTVNIDTHYITFGFQETRNEPWRLSDLIFGRLSRGNVLARR